MKYRIEKDSMGEIKVPSNKYYGAQTERSKNNFKIGTKYEKMPDEIIKALGIIKYACAITNKTLKPDCYSDEKFNAILKASKEVFCGKLKGNFPLVVFQTGSGTQSNMNVNEVISCRANEILKENLCHPNDDINMSQSSNDTFPSAMNIAADTIIERKLLPKLTELIKSLKILEKENEDIIKCGRTHLQDAVPIKFSQEISGWRGMLESSYEQINTSIYSLKNIALGATAVGTGLNCIKGFDKMVAEKISEITKIKFESCKNKFYALTSKDAFVFVHGAIKGLACNLMKIANDIRWLSSGPRNGLAEIFIPENEPGSSIMPGKVNPTQCESLTMVCVQVMANDTAITVGASQGNFELNVFMPLIAYNFLQSVRLLSESIDSFNKNCVKGIKPNKEKMRDNLNSSLMLVTALSPYIGYENSCLTAKKAMKENITLKEACIKLKFLSEKEFDKIFHPEFMADEEKNKK